MKNRSKTLKNIIAKISGFMGYHSLRIFGSIPRHNTYRIPVLLERDLDLFLGEGETIHCLVCRNTLTSQNIGTLVAFEGKYRFCCKSISCQDKLRGQGYE